MQTPTYARNQFIDDVLLNQAAGVVTANFQQLNQAIVQPGLFFPGTLALTTSGLAATITASLPFQVVFGTGVMASAHGNTTGQDSATTSVDFTGIVPVSGSVTAYLLVAAGTVEQIPQPLIGPPPGHPDFNPQYTPSTTYVDTLDTLLFSASTAPPDNVNTFEIGRVTLAAAATGLGTFDFSNQRSASTYQSRTLVQFSGNITITPSEIGLAYVATDTANFTLPPAKANNGIVLHFTSATGNAVTVQTQGGEQIFGVAGSPGTGVSSIILSQGSALVLEAQFGAWQITGGTASAQGGGAAVPAGTIFDFAGGTVPAGYLLCSGQAVSRTTFSALFAAIGTQYGAGDGSTTFNVPDYRGNAGVGLDNMGGTAANRIPGFTALGQLTGVYQASLTSGQLPPHQHGVSGTTGNENQNHTHGFSGNTGTESAGHSHNYATPSATAGSGGDPQPVWANSLGGTGTTGGENQNHTHGFSGTTATEGQSHNHNFNGTTDNGPGTSAPVSLVQPIIGILKIIKY